MPIILFLAFPFCEFYLLFKAADHFGFWMLLGYTLASGFIGLGLMGIIGETALRSFQIGLARGEPPTTKILHRGMMFIGALLVFLPGVITDIMGFALLLPGLRHLIVFYVKFLIARGMFKGSVKVFNFGSGAWGAAASSVNFEREVRPTASPTDPNVIEVAHKRIETIKS